MNHDRLLQHQEMCSQQIIIINFSIEQFQLEPKSVNVVFHS